MPKRYQIQFPAAHTEMLDQDEAYFYLTVDGQRQKVRFHEYAELFKRPGLYEQLFYDRLKCQSPKKVTAILHEAIEEDRSHFSELRVLDVGAGNGIMGETMKNHGVARLVGLDIIEEAKLAAERDRPSIYDEYYVCDCNNLSEQQTEDLKSWSANCLVSVAALGYGDIPPQAFLNAMNLIQDDGWVAINIKETFLDESDKSGFSRMIRELIFSEYLDVHHLERYWHRYSIEGTPLYYFAFVGRRNGMIPADFLESLNLDGADAATT